jgi:thiol-disulfide isomerase/thioredoxin
MSVAPRSRRGWLAAAVGVAVAAGGAGIILRRNQRQPRELTEAEQAIWQLEFTQVNGSPLAMSVFKGRPLVLNFWATWCPPCVAELPLLSAFFSENKAKNWQVLGLAVDQVAPVQRFLAQSPLSFPVALAGFPGVELSRSLGNLTGGLPFTVVFDSAGLVRSRKMGKLVAADLQTWQTLPGHNDV